MIRIIINQKRLGSDNMTDRKWRIITNGIDKEFYKKIAKYESEGYKLIPESFGYEVHKGFYALMLNMNFKE